MALKIKTSGLESYLDGGQSYLKVLMLGNPGVGKTRWAGFWPRPFFLDFDDGMMSLADRQVPYIGTVGPDSMKNTEDVLSVLDDMKRQALDPGSRRFDTVVVDTLDKFQRFAIAERLRETGRAGLSGWEDWGWLDARMQAVFTRLFGLRMHVLVNVHLKQYGDDEDIYWLPKLKGDARESIAEDFSLVGVMESRWEAIEGERKRLTAIQWEPKPGFEILKDRSYSLGAETVIHLDEPGDFDRMLAAFKARADLLKPSEAMGDIEAPAQAEPVTDATGGPVPPARTAATAPPAKKAETKPAEEKKAVAAPAAAVEVTESGPITGPASAEATTDVVEKPTQEATMKQAVETAQEALGGTVVSETPAADVKGAADEQPPIPCGTPGKLRQSTEINPDPVKGCGRDTRALARTSKEAVDAMNFAFMRTRTYLCPACFAAWEAEQAAAPAAAAAK